MKHLFIMTILTGVIATTHAQMGLGTNNPAVKMHIKSNSAMLRLEGTDHAFMEFYPKGSSTRYAYFGNPNSGTNDMYLFNENATGSLVMGTNNLKRMHIASTGKVGIGNFTPSTALHIENGNTMSSGDPGNNDIPSVYIYNNNSSSSSAHSILGIRTNGNGSGNPYLSLDINGIRGFSMGMDNADGEKLKFFSNWNFNTGQTPVLTMTTDDKVGIGTASPGNKLEIVSSDGTSLKITSSTTDNNGMIVLNANTDQNWGGDWHEFIMFQKQGNTIGTIKGSSSGSGVSYNTTSDYRLKTDFKNFSGLDLINQLKVYDYAWKENNTRMYGFKAHEIQEVIPYITTGKKDAVDAQGKPVYQMVDYSKLTPVLAKAIQEQQAIIVNQQERIEKLERMIQEIVNAKK